LPTYGYNRKGKRDNPQIAHRLQTDEDGERPTCRVFKDNSAAPPTVPTALPNHNKRCRGDEEAAGADGVMAIANDNAAGGAAGLRYLTALSDPQVRRLLKRDVLQLELFAEQVCEVQADGKRYILRKNEAEARKARHRLDDKLTTLQALVATRNTRVA